MSHSSRHSASSRSRSRPVRSATLRATAPQAAHAHGLFGQPLFAPQRLGPPRSRPCSVSHSSRHSASSRSRFDCSSLPLLRHRLSCHRPRSRRRHDPTPRCRRRCTSPRRSGSPTCSAKRRESTDDLVAACDGEARVLLIERDLADPAASWLDLQMLVMLSGRERTEDEYAALFRAAGLEPLGHDANLCGPQGVRSAAPMITRRLLPVRRPNDRPGCRARTRSPRRSVWVGASEARCG